MIIINDRDWQSAIMLLQEQASHSDDKSLSFSDKQLFKERFLNAANQLNDSRYDEVLGKIIKLSTFPICDFVTFTRYDIF